MIKRVKEIERQKHRNCLIKEKERGKEKREREREKRMGNRKYDITSCKNKAIGRERERER